MKVQDRFLKYVAIPTMSDENSETIPSSEKQLVLAKVLVDELLELGLKDARVDKYGYVYATLPANTDKAMNKIGFISHMDTSPDAPDSPIDAKIVEYNGGDILLNEKENIIMKVSDYPNLERYKGQHLIVTDGTTLLGSDDKAGVAEIMDALKKIIESGMAHGKISVAFTPDEEIGRGADYFDVEVFGADYAYTVDGGSPGEIEYENFNGASAEITVHGRSIHPGSAKGKMINAARMACEFDGALPQNEVPECTEGYEGFHHLTDMSGETEIAKLSYIIRDHDKEKFEDKKKQFETVAEEFNKRYGEGTVELKITDSYYNMKEKIEPHMYIIERAKKAMEDTGIVPEIIPIRGGTDGARLSYMGLPCPNLCTGGENFHSRFEYVSVEAMEQISDMLVKIVDNLVEK
ncbi:MAG: peptidase T [Ruminococcaceae bacterium]|nr:peptidase T [Oscillospiraceae bacterium]